MKILWKRENHGLLFETEGDILKYEVKKWNRNSVILMITAMLLW